MNRQRFVNNYFSQNGMKVFQALFAIIFLFTLIGVRPLQPAQASDDFNPTGSNILGSGSPGPTLTCDQPVRIMPVGDSITRGVYGSSDNTGYRRSLYLQLTGAGYTGVDFVGSQSDGNPSDFDKNHEGRDGWKAHQIRDNIYSWLEAQDGPNDDEPVDIILLHIGTNDISQAGDNSEATRDAIAQILDKIDDYETAYNTTIMVFLARIINRNDSNAAETTALNGLIQSLADTRIAAGDDIIVVDMESALNYPGDLADAVHPNDTGYGKMANTWASVILNYLPTICSPDSPVVYGISLNSTSSNHHVTDDLTCDYTLGGTATTSATAWAVDGSPQMALYLPMEGGATNALLDYSGSNKHVNKKGTAAVWGETSGFGGRGGFSFDHSSNAYLEINGAMPSGAYTKTAWVYANQINDCHNIISGDYSNALWVNNNRLQAGHNGGWTNHVRDSVDFPLGAWTFVAVTFDGSQMILYKNGNPVATNNSVPVHSCPACADPALLQIGAFSNTPSGHAQHCTWNGGIDDARVYGFSLSPQQIAALYNAGAGDANTIVSQETSVGEDWQCQVTPFSDSEAGPLVASNMVTIVDDSTPPLVENVILSSSPAGGGLFSDDLSCGFDISGSATTAATAWVVDGSPQMTLYLPMEGGEPAALADYSGNSNPAAVKNGNPIWSASAGHDGKGAYTFGGNNDLKGGEVFPTLSSYTKTAWVYRTGSGANGGNNIISGDTNAGGHALWAPDVYSNRLSAGHNQKWDFVQDDVPLALNTWYHVAVTFNYDTGEMVLYKNGVVVDSGIIVPTGPAATGTAVKNVTDSTVSIGSFGASNGWMWKGTIDDVRVYPQALSADQIAALYGGGTGDANTIRAAETSVGETWQCKVTPFSDSQAGTLVASNILTVQFELFAPYITSSPVLEAFQNQPYVYPVEAEGNPAPVFSLDHAPNGMVIDPLTGLIEWTPAAAGVQDVVVRAENSEGFDTQAFTITVSLAPSCPLDMSAYWKLDETTPGIYADFIGSNDALCTGAECPAPGAGILNGGQVFSRALQNNVSVPPADAFNWGMNDSFTIEYWMKGIPGTTCKGSSVGNNEVIVGRQGAGAHGTNIHIWTGCSAYESGGVDGGRAAWQLRDENYGGGSIVGTTNIADGQWHHIVAIRDKAANKNYLYVDGALEGELSHNYTAGFTSATEPLNIGWLNLSAGYYYSGTVDEIALYNRALTQDEILSHYNNGLARNLCPYPPSDILLSNDVVEEEEPAGTQVGEFSTIDLDPGDTHTYTLVPGDGSDDNALFVIIGNELQTAAELTPGIKTIRVRSTDSFGLYLEKVFEITVGEKEKDTFDIFLPLILH